MFKLPKASFLVLPLLVSAVVAGCGEYRHDLMPAKLSSYSDAYEKRAADMRDAMEKGNLVFRIARFVDRRVPEAYSDYEPHIVMHTYDPDKLPGNAAGYVRSVMTESMTLDTQPVDPDTLEVFFELRNMDMRILNGNFVSGASGRYYVKVDADVMVRDGNGKIVLKKPYEVKYETVRQSFNGGQVSIDTDWHDMIRTTRAAIQHLTFEVMDDTLDKSNKTVMDGEVTDRPIRRSPQVFAP